MSEEERTMSPLREGMSKLDHAIHDYIFDDEGGEEQALASLIANVWDEIDNVEKLDIRYRNTRR